MSIFHGFVVFCLFAGTSGHLRYGPFSSYRKVDKLVPCCPTADIFPAFNQTKFVGTWYNNGIFGNGNLRLACMFEHWIDKKNGELSLLNSYLEYRNGNVSQLLVKQDLRAPNSSNPEQFLLIKNGRKTRTVEYNSILRTDYISYAVRCHCSSKVRVRSRIIIYSPHMEILTRERIPSQAVIDEIVKYVRERSLPTMNYFKDHEYHYNQYNQTGCEIADIESLKENLMNESRNLNK